MHNKSITNHKLTIHRDGVRLGEWSEHEIEQLYADGLLQLTDVYSRDGKKERIPLQFLLQPVKKSRPNIFAKAAAV